MDSNCFTMELQALESEVLTVYVTDEIGCSRTVTLSIRVELPDYISVPNIFSPNGDGNNDLFTIFLSSFAELNSFIIYDRWGSEVYRIDDTNTENNIPEWDGWLNGRKVAEGVYVYVADLSLQTGENVIKTGDISLVR